jgi:chromosome segregation ATPase
MTDDVGVLMLEQLKGLRGDIGALREDVQGTNARLDQTNARLDQTNARLDNVEETLKDLATQMLILARFVRNIGDKYDRELDEIKERLGRVENKLG